MIDNAVLRLRAERLARATRPFLARGNRIRRCQRCLLPLKQCLCATLAPAQADSRFCLVMFDTEPMKPSNTGRLIADILPNTEAFQWSRTEPPQALLDLVANPDYQPMVVFPASYAGAERQVLSAPPEGKPPLFIMLDGTWTEARKMFRKKPVSRCAAGNLCRPVAHLRLSPARSPCRRSVLYGGSRHRPAGLSRRRAGGGRAWRSL
ncbi:DTW domain-containing protein yfiP (plasmid) [Klebsiella aerogenes]|nr:DTW domain-containing protein yfiP [Klebsiella aerogenes]